MTGRAGEDGWCTEHGWTCTSKGEPCWTPLPPVAGRVFDMPIVVDASVPAGCVRLVGESRSTTVTWCATCGTVIEGDRRTCGCRP